MIKTKRSALPLLAVGATMCALLAAPAAPGATIDDFRSALAGWPVIQNTVGGGTVSEFVGGVLGGVRDTSIAATSLELAGPDFVQVGIYPAASVFDYSSTVGADGTAGLRYDGGSGLGGVDFSSDVFLGIDFVHFDLANGIAMPVKVTLTDTLASFAATTLSLTVAGAQSLQFPLAGFAGVDLTSIDTIEIGFDPGQATDFRLALVYTDVPEPATLGLLLIGGMIWSRRGVR